MKIPSSSWAIQFTLDLNKGSPTTIHGKQFPVYTFLTNDGFSLGKNDDDDHHHHHHHNNNNNSNNNNNNKWRYPGILTWGAPKSSIVMGFTWTYH